MSTTYDYSYDYDVDHSNRNTRKTTNNNQPSNRYSNNHQTNPAVSTTTYSDRLNNMDPLVNLQHDRIWNKLYDPVDSDRIAHDAEAQKMARRQDRKVIKIEASHGSDRQTFIIKRNYDLRALDLLDEAAKNFKIPLDSLVVYWKGRNLCETPNELLETLGIENNHQIRICRDDDPAQQSRRRELRGQPPSDQSFSMSNDFQKQQSPYSSYQPYPPMMDQQQPMMQGFGQTPRQNYYQQLTNPAGPGPNASSFILNLQIGFGDRVDGLAIGRPHPISIYDLQTELQQRYNIPILEQNVSYNGMPLTQLPPDASLETVGIGNNSFISLWYRPPPSQFQQQQPMMNDYNSSRQGPPQSVYPDSFPMLRPADGSNGMNNDQMQSGGNQDVMKIEVFHGSDRHVLILRSTNNLRVIDLMEELQRITTVPLQQQKLYFRGQELQTVKDRSLRDAGLENNAQVRMIGDPIRSRYEPIISGNRPN